MRKDPQKHVKLSSHLTKIYFVTIRDRQIDR